MEKPCINISEGLSPERVKLLLFVTPGRARAEGAAPGAVSAGRRDPCVQRGRKEPCFLREERSLRAGSTGEASRAPCPGHRLTPCAPENRGTKAGIETSTRFLGDVLPSPNVGLPGALIPREPPGPAYVTHRGPLVRLLLAQEGQGRAARAGPAPPGPRTEPRPRTELRTEPRPRTELRTEPRPRTELRTEPRPRTEPSPESGAGSGTAGSREGSTGIPAAPALAPPSICHRIVFARKPPSTVLPGSDLACSSRRE
ncbi:N-acetyl-beta-glucosaminyl-glycoprotein 4-beta-N-acetylgalactosaminyltransferase 1-like [Prinia subflava]|uniref:N-acetyl-beta-glucosaminyl-glycoprotein 4-beta-N-acetylgalactosaminyltransferase 1-like n=1 Tax=Prinia subflava TaxID=208062 RepID=UPI002FE31B80